MCTAGFPIHLYVLYQDASEYFACMRRCFSLSTLRGSLHPEFSDAVEGCTVADDRQSQATSTRGRKLNAALDQLLAAQDARVATESLRVSSALRSLPRHQYCAPRGQVCAS